MTAEPIEEQRGFGPTRYPQGDHPLLFRLTHPSQLAVTPDGQRRRGSRHTDRAGVQYLTSRMRIGRQSAGGNADRVGVGSGARPVGFGTFGRGSAGETFSRPRKRPGSITHVRLGRIVGVC